MTAVVPHSPDAAQSQRSARWTFPRERVSRHRGGLWRRMGQRAERAPRVTVILLASDVCALALASAILSAGSRSGLLVGLLTVVQYQITGLYRSRLTLSLLDDLPRLSVGMLFAVAATAFTAALFGHANEVRPIAATGLAAGGLVVVTRSTTYAAIRQGRARGVITYRTLVVGAGEVGNRLARTLREHPEYGLRLVGVVDSYPQVKDSLPVPLLDGGSELDQAIVTHDAAVVIVAFGGVPERDLVSMLRTCDALDCEIFLVPRLFEVHAIGTADQVWGIPLVRLRRAPYRRLAWKSKRGFDVAAAAVALMVLAPVLLAVAVAVRLETGPGVIFRQLRVGRYGRTFTLLKFRSLRPDDEDESRTQWSVAEDERIGAVGRFIRRTSLDELPQLVNVLRGDMSLVGPRPERPHFVEHFTVRFPCYQARHRVPAGMTGWAAVNGLRGDTSIEERAYFDNLYIENWSLWLDVKILLRTVTAVLRGRGA
jgi:exopolysaccharide biosynthesis polyprenyl glycosylphosphotransferase